MPTAGHISYNFTFRNEYIEVKIRTIFFGKVFILSVRVCVYIYVCICLYINIYKRMHIYAYMYTPIIVCTHNTHRYITTYIYMYTYSIYLN